MANQRKFESGTKIYYLTVIGYNSKKSLYVCKCDCGRTTEANVFSLTHGKHKSCGCPQFRPKKVKSLSPGDRFGHLTVVSFSEIDGAWVCSCVCGGTTLAEAPRLKNGSRTGCGCRISTAQRPNKWLPDDLSFKRKLYNNYKKQAAKRSLSFDFTFEEFTDYLFLPCAYCGEVTTNVMTQKSRTGRSIRTFQYNGIDRVDNTIGYSTKNCVACCKNCNYAKRDLGHGQFLELCKKVAARFSLHTTEDASKLLTKECRVYLVATGAGAGLQQMLWNIPGISQVLVGAEFPYATEATDRFLGFQPDSYCSVKTALSLAMEAYYRAFQPGGAPAVGLGLTASVASTRAHRGDHRVFVATVSDTDCMVHTAVLAKGVGDEPRKRDGEISDRFGLMALQNAVGVEDTTDIGYSVLGFESQSVPDLALAILLEHPFWLGSGGRKVRPSNGNSLTLFPGAFNPPHNGHFWMARENSAIFHITINPPHKDALSVTDILKRARLLEGFPRIFTEDDPLYIDKARRFPGSRILIGVDALERMLDPKWGVEIEPMLEEFNRLGIKFLVADREVKGKIRTVDDLPIPSEMCRRVLQPSQTLSMSSTKIREGIVT